MKAYKLEILIIDNEDRGIDNIKEIIESNRYVYPQILECNEFDIGEWSDDHPLNHSATQKEYISKFMNGQK